jgi:hypothetical protein
MAKSNYQECCENCTNLNADDAVFIETLLDEKYSTLGIDRPEIHLEILRFIVKDVDETADPIEWHSGDVDIAFMRFLESKRPE